MFPFISYNPYPPFCQTTSMELQILMSAKI